jgi:hypothetical protein
MQREFSIARRTFVPRGRWRMSNAGDIAAKRLGFGSLVVAQGFCNEAT